MANASAEALQDLRHRAEEKAFIDERTAAIPLSPMEKERLLYELLRTKAELENLVEAKNAALSHSNEEMNKIAFQLVWAEERKRERIAAELHDQVGQSLLLAKMKLDALTENILTDSLRSYAEEVDFLLSTSIRDIRELTFKMRPTILDNAEIATALEYLCSSMGDDYSLQIDFKNDGQPKPMSAEVRYSLYQAVRELLLNIVKHAGADKAQLSLQTENQTLVVLVEDNGVGFSNPEDRPRHSDICGYDLYNVKQRMGFMGGSFTVESEPGTGTRVTLTVPLGEE